MKRKASLKCAQKSEQWLIALQPVSSQGNAANANEVVISEPCLIRSNIVHIKSFGKNHPIVIYCFLFFKQRVFLFQFKH